MSQTISIDGKAIPLSKLFVVLGRLPSNREDTVSIVEADSVSAAEAGFADMMCRGEDPRFVPHDCVEVSECMTLEEALRHREVKVS